MKRPLTDGGMKPFNTHRLAAYVALNPASEEEGAPAAGSPQQLATVLEYGQWTGWRASDEAEALAISYSGAMYDPLLEAWTCEPFTLDLDSVLLSGTNHKTGTPAEFPRPTDIGYYGWHVLAGGQAVPDDTYDVGDTTDDTEEVVGGLDVATWCTTTDDDDGNVQGLRQQAPCSEFAITSGAESPLPHDPSFEIRLRVDHLQADEDGEVQDFYDAFLAVEFGAGRWRLSVRPSATSGKRNDKTQWGVYLEERLGDSWVVRLGDEQKKGHPDETASRGLSKLRPGDNDLLRIMVQCVDGRIVVRDNSRNPMGTDGEVYTKFLPSGDAVPIHVASGPVSIYGMRCTFRMSFRRVVYTQYGWVMFPSRRLDYSSQVGVPEVMTENLVVTITGTGIVRKGLPANAAPFTFTHFSAEDYHRNEWQFPRVYAPYAGFDPNETFVAIAARKKTALGGELGLEFTRPSLPLPGEWQGYDEALDSDYLFALRLRSSWRSAGPAGTQLLDPYYGDSTLVGETPNWGAHTVCVRTVKWCWPTIMSETVINWVDLSTGIPAGGSEAIEGFTPQDWIGWSASQSLSDASCSSTKATVELDDTALPGAIGKTDAWHGRRLMKLSGWWANKAGTEWCGGDRWWIITSGKDISVDAKIPGAGLLSLLDDLSDYDTPMCDGELFSDIIKRILTAAGIPVSMQDVANGHHRAPLQSPGKSSRHFAPEEMKGGKEVVERLAQVCGFTLYERPGEVVWADLLSAPTSEQIARRFTYSDGHRDVSLPDAWSVKELGASDPAGADREFTDVEVQVDTEAGPYRSRMRVSSPDRAGSMTVIGGLGKVRVLVKRNRDMSTKGEADWLCRTLHDRAAADIGDITVALAHSDPELCIMDVGCIALSRTQNSDAQDVEVVSISESIERGGTWGMQVQARAARGTKGGGIS